MIVKNHLIIFSKVPRYGAVKKRLAKDIGDMEALKFYKNNLHKNLRVLGSDLRWNCSLALSQVRSDIRNDFGWRWVVFFQGLGDLGKKMKNCIQSIPNGNVVLVGGDIANLNKSTISIAFKKLQCNDLVFGPSCDGGFWLLGVKGDLQERKRNIFRIFKSVRWSSEFAFEDTLKNINNKKIALVDMLDDVDNLESYSKNRVKVCKYN